MSPYTQKNIYFIDNLFYYIIKCEIIKKKNSGSEYFLSNHDYILVWQITLRVFI